MDVLFDYIPSILNFFHLNTLRLFFKGTLMFVFKQSLEHAENIYRDLSEFHMKYEEFKYLNKEAMKH